LRRVEALDLRIRGSSFRKIATELNVSVGQAYADVTEALEGLAGLEKEKAEDCRRLDLERTDALIAGHFKRATEGFETLDKEGNRLLLGPDDKSARVVLSALERRAKLLGIDAPEKHQLNTDTDVEMYLKVKYGIPTESKAAK